MSKIAFQTENLLTQIGFENAMLLLPTSIYEVMCPSSHLLAYYDGIFKSFEIPSGPQMHFQWNEGGG